MVSEKAIRLVILHVQDGEHSSHFDEHDVKTFFGISLIMRPLALNFLKKEKHEKAKKK